MCVGWLYAVVALWAVCFARVELIPDTSSYAHGGSGWSSMLAAGSGAAAGIDGVRLVGVLGAIALGVSVAIVGGPTRALILLLALAALPHFPGFAASPDAAGAAAAALAYRRGRLGALVALVHLEAGLVLLATALARRTALTSPWTAILAGVGAVVALALVGLVVGVHPDELQTRYLLPGFAIVAAHWRPSRVSLAQAGAPA